MNITELTIPCTSSRIERDREMLQKRIEQNAKVLKLNRIKSEFCQLVDTLSNSEKAIKECNRSIQKLQILQQNSHRISRQKAWQLISNYNSLSIDEILDEVNQS